MAATGSTPLFIYTCIAWDTVTHLFAVADCVALSRVLQLHKPVTEDVVPLSQHRISTIWCQAHRSKTLRQTDRHTYIQTELTCATGNRLGTDIWQGPVRSQRSPSVSTSNKIKPTARWESVIHVSFFSSLTILALAFSNLDQLQ